MDKLFLICGVVGSTALILQFVVTLLGFGMESFHSDHFDLGHAGHGGDSAGHDWNRDGLNSHLNSTWLFGVVSLRTMVAALAFFGLGGYAALAADQGPVKSLVIALAAGVAAMYGVHWLLRLMYQLTQDRTHRIERAVGVHGKVYIPIPGDNQGCGKVQLSVQDRIVEYAAITAEPKSLPTGATVVVTRVIDSATVEVETSGQSLRAATS